jgi:hypothetical protein
MMLGLGSSVLALRQGLTVKTRNTWSAPLAEALAALPSTEICPHDLYARFCAQQDRSRKLIFEFSEKGEPVAVACLRERGRYWVPVTHYIVPGLVFPVKAGFLPRVLASLNLNIAVGLWRCVEAATNLMFVRDLEDLPTYGMRCDADFESYWREQGLSRDIRVSRNRCRDFAIKVDQPGVTEWTIRQAEAKWRPAGTPERDDLPDRVMAAAYLEPRGLCRNLSLWSGTELIAAIVFLIHGSDAIAWVNYRVPHYNWHAPMTRLMEVSFAWAKESGYCFLDIGGGFAYKEHWAPVAGLKWDLNICPSPLSQILAGRRLITTVGTKYLRRVVPAGATTNAGV